MVGEPLETSDPVREYSLDGFAVPGELEGVHSLLSQAAVENPEVHRDDLVLFETALLEIANNVVEHGRPLGKVRWQFLLRVHTDQIEAELTDSGLTEPPLDQAQMPEPLAESGRGLAMARAVLDEVRVVRENEANRWVLVRRLRR